jgi:hypothetical protein
VRGEREGEGRLHHVPPLDYHLAPHSHFVDIGVDPVVGEKSSTSTQDGDGQEDALQDVTQNGRYRQAEAWATATRLLAVEAPSRRPSCRSDRHRAPWPAVTTKTIFCKTPFWPLSVSLSCLSPPLLCAGCVSQPHRTQLSLAPALSRSWCATVRSEDRERCPAAERCVCVLT